MKKFIAVLLSIFTLTLLSVGIVSAQESKAVKKIVTLEKDQIIDRDYFAVAEEVKIYGTVNGDVYAAGGKVLVEGAINGSLLVAAGEIEISGTVSENVRVVGGQVMISGEIGRSLTVGAGNVEITDSAKIGRTLVAGAGNVELSGPVEGDMKIGASNLVISSKVQGNIDTGVGTLKLEPGAEINGDFTYWSDTEAEIDKEATVTGMVVKNQPPTQFSKPDFKEAGEALRKVGRTISAVTKVIGFLSSLLIGLLLIRFFPKCMEKKTKIITNNIGKTLGVGFAALVLTPIVFILLLFTAIGIPLAFFILFAYLAFLYTSKIIIAFWLGLQTFEKIGQESKNWQALILGLLIYSFITMIPRIGGLASFASLVIGLGAIILGIKDTYTAGKKKNII